MMTDHTKQIAKELIAFSFPLILSGILQQLYNWVDAFIVGNVEGDQALAAVGATTTIINFYINAITGFTLGLSILFAQKFGSGEEKGFRKTLSAFTVVLGGFFVVAGGAGIILADPILQLLQTTPDTFALAGDYLQIVLAGVPFLAIYNVYCAALRGRGNSKASFYSVLISSVINVGLDILLVAVLRWSVTGAAVATVSSQIIMTVFVVGYSIKKYPKMRYRLGRNCIERKALREGWKFGILPMVQSSISSAGNLVLQRFMNGFGTYTVTAITTAYRVDSIVLLPIINLGSAISTMIAHKHGKGEVKQSKQIFVIGIALMSGIALVLTALIILFGGKFIAMFGAGREAVSIGNAFFLRIACFYIVFGLATAVRGYLEGIGNLVYSSFAGVISLAARILLSYALAAFFGNMVIAYAEAFSWVILLGLYAIRLKKKRIN